MAVKKVACLSPTNWFLREITEISNLTHSLHTSAHYKKFKLLKVVYKQILIYHTIIVLLFQAFLKNSRRICRNVEFNLLDAYGL